MNRYLYQFPLVLVLLISGNSIAQDTLYVHKKGGQVVKYSTNSIDSLTFAQDTSSVSTVADIEGNIYPTVVIGTQTWMAKNLNVSKFSNGDNIPTTSPSWKDITNEPNALYQWDFLGINAPSSAYGKLYTWAVATDPRNVCPTGWKIPSDGDYTILTSFLGGIETIGGSVGGAALKDTTAEYWGASNTSSVATNSTGFSARGGGSRQVDGLFKEHHTGAHWWTTTVKSLNTAGNSVYRGVVSHDPYIWRYSHTPNFGLGLRCLKN